MRPFIERYLERWCGLLCVTWVTAGSLCITSPHRAPSLALHRSLNSRNGLSEPPVDKTWWRLKQALLPSGAQCAKAFQMRARAHAHLHGDILCHLKGYCLTLNQVAKVVNEGNLLPDSYVLQLLQQRLAEGARRGEEGVLLDGFPRTRAQAEALLTFSDVQLALNLHLREEVGAACVGTPSPALACTELQNRCCPFAQQCQ